MSKRVRQKPSVSLAAPDGLAKVKLTEVDEDAEMATPVPDTPVPEPVAEDDVISPPVSAPLPEPKSPNRIALEKNLSISRYNISLSPTPPSSMITLEWLI